MTVLPVISTPAPAACVWVKLPALSDSEQLHPAHIRVRGIFCYTMTPQSGLNKTAAACGFAWFNVSPKLCAPAQGRVPCTRAAAQAAALRLSYHDAAKRPQQNRTCCGFAWFNVLKALCASTGACACTRAAAQAAALRLLYHDAAKRPQQNRTCCGFAWFNVFKALCASAGACACTRAAAQAAA